VAELVPKVEVAPAPREPRPGDPLLVGEIVARYQEYAKSYYARDGIATGEHITVRNALRPLVEAFRELPATELGPKKFKALLTHMIARGWCRNTVNKARGIVVRCFNWAASEELIPASVPAALRTVPGLRKGRTAAKETPAVRPVDDRAVEATLPFLGDLVADMVRLQRLTGMRPGELLVISGDAIDRSDSECWRYEPAHHKCEHHDQARVVYIGPRAIEILLPRLIQAGDGRIFLITRAAYRRAIVRACRRAFPHPSISAIKPANRTAEQRAELKAWSRAHDWSPNQLRHSLATEVRAKFDLEAAQVILGHAQADVTQIYAEKNARKAREVARKIG
jgi:integrase